MSQPVQEDEKDNDEKKDCTDFTDPVTGKRFRLQRIDDISYWVDLDTGERIPYDKETPPIHPEHLHEKDDPEFRAQRPRANLFDEVRIITVPRFKDSHLSGSEWRISARVQFMLKGEVLHTQDAYSLERGIHTLSHAWYNAIESFKGSMRGVRDFCDQEGCSEKSEYTYRMKRVRYHTGETNMMDVDQAGWQGQNRIRKFCDRHAKRGDQGCDDCDDNYDVVERPEGKDVPSQPRPEDVSVPSIIVMGMGDEE